MGLSRFEGRGSTRFDRAARVLAKDNQRTANQRVAVRARKAERLFIKPFHGLVFHPHEFPAIRAGFYGQGHPSLSSLFLSIIGRFQLSALARFSLGWLTPAPYTV